MINTVQREATLGTARNRSTEIACVRLPLCQLHSMQSGGFAQLLKFLTPFIQSLLTQWFIRSNLQAPICATSLAKLFFLWPPFQSHP